MTQYHIPTDPARRRTLIHLALWACVSFAVTLVIAAAVARFRHGRAPVPEAPLEVLAPPLPSDAPSVLAVLALPTAWDLLDATNAAAMFMPTASGNAESAFFGSTRTGGDNRARFHSGVDVAPKERDRRGKPLDAVGAIADGKVAYINRVGGDSNYGAYVVLIHDDPIGPVYSLYAHLASVAKDLTVGAAVKAGAPIAVMGNSSSTGIPLARAHLHLEIGLVHSGRFGAWTKAKAIRPDRGNYHGWNLFAVNPLDVFTQQRQTPHFSFAAYLKTVPAAFELVLAPKRWPDFFARYPRLWLGESASAPTIVLRVSEGGVILSGRPATAAEAAAVATARGPVVQNVDEVALGRNGMRLADKRGDRWVLGRAAQRWIETLTF